MANHSWSTDSWPAASGRRGRGKTGADQAALDPHQGPHAGSAARWTASPPGDNRRPDRRWPLAWLEQTLALAIVGDDGVWLGRGNSIEHRSAAEVATGLPLTSWRHLPVDRGPTSAQTGDWACVPLAQVIAAPAGQWLVVRRDQQRPPGLTYFLAIGPAGTSPDEIVGAVARRRAGDGGTATMPSAPELDLATLGRGPSWSGRLATALLVGAYATIIDALLGPANGDHGRADAC